MPTDAAAAAANKEALECVAALQGPLHSITMNPKYATKVAVSSEGTLIRVCLPPPGIIEECVGFAPGAYYHKEDVTAISYFDYNKPTSPIVTVGDGTVAPGGNSGFILNATIRCLTVDFGLLGENVMGACALVFGYYVLGAILSPDYPVANAAASAAAAAQIAAYMEKYPNDPATPVPPPLTPWGIAMKRVTAIHALYTSEVDTLFFDDMIFDCDHVRDYGNRRLQTSLQTATPTSQTSQTATPQPGTTPSSQSILTDLPPLPGQTGQPTPQQPNRGLIRRAFNAVTTRNP